MLYDTGLIMWLRGLSDRPAKNRISTNDPIDQRFSALAVREGLATLHEPPNFMTEAEQAYVLIVELTAKGVEALAENP